MNKRKYTVVGATILVFIIIIAVILLKNNKVNLEKEILNSDNYKIAMKNCNNRETEYPKNELNKIFKKLKNISNNGPWTGDNNECYSTLIITYEKNDSIKTIEILIIDDTSIVIDTNKEAKYYTNAGDVVNYLNSLFQTY